MKSRICFGGVLLAMFAAAWWVATVPLPARAMPNFARKYNAQCNMCHTAVPKLNRVGYEFRAAGFRLPASLGQPEPDYNLGDNFTARIQANLTVKRHEEANPIKDYGSTQLEFFEATLYPLTGSWGKNFGSEVELSMAPDDVFEVENAYVRAAFGDEDKGWWMGRLGVMHPWEGMGASDRPLGNIRPLFQKNKAVGSPFILWNLDEPAFELGYHYPKTGTTLTARVSNGIIWKEDGSGTAEPAQGGALAKLRHQPTFNNKSYQFFLNQFIGDYADVSAYYYHGAVPFPDPTGSPNNANGITADNFDRFAVYANVWPIKEKLNLLGGYQAGHDSLKDPTVAGATTVGNSFGYYGEFNYHPIPKAAVGFRYDYFDPSTLVTANSLNAYTVSANYAMWNGLQFVADYQQKLTRKGTGVVDTKDDQFQARMIYLW